MHNLLTTCAIGTSPATEQHDRLALILDEYLQALERGEPVTPDELLARHPEVAERLRGYLSGLKLFHHAVAERAPSPLLGGGDLGPELRGDLGDFRLVREIGRGGMGVVYEGVQVSLGRRVALKVLPFSAAIDEKQITRFKNEAQAAAQVDHPNIVPVFAIGQERGIHYFAMQLIGGQSLHDFLIARRAEAEAVVPSLVKSSSDILGTGIRGSTATDYVKAVARMGVQAAEALHAAHEIGVVHRDVKPSNLLLDEKGKVWVTDFGVARCKSNPNLTETGHLLGTMLYMSPEQAAGRAALVDHRTDIYSLGVTLYELATLRHPIEGDAHEETALEFDRAKWRPPRYWNRSIPADFENIILKATAETREERYATAREMADDLERFLHGKPILARRPSFAARLGKWTGRHKPAVAAAMGALALAVIGLAGSLIVITGERAQQEVRLRQAREVLDRFGSRVAERLADVAGEEQLRQELLAEMLPYYREFARAAAGDSSARADLAVTFSKIGYLADELGSHVEAEEAYREALATLQTLTQPKSPRPEYLRDLALCSNNLGQLLQKRGAMAAARQHLDRALKVQQQLLAKSPQSTIYRADLATTHGNLGLLLHQTGDKRQAAEHFHAAIAIQDALRAAAPNDEANLSRLAASYNNLSALFREAEPSVAWRWLENSLSVQLSLVKSQPRQLKYQSALALGYSNLGAMHARLSRPADAERCFRDAITIQQRLALTAPLVATYRRDLAVSHNNLGMMHAAAIKLPEAEAAFEQALAIQQELIASREPSANLLSSLGGIYNNLGLVQQQQERLPAASLAFARAISAQQQASKLAPEAVHLREALSKHYYNHSQVLLALGRPADAAAQSLARRPLWAGNAPRLLRVAHDLAVACQRMEPGDARQQYLNETQRTLEAAHQAGLEREKMPDIKAAPFNVLAEAAAASRSQSRQPTPVITLEHPRAAAMQ